MDRIYLLCLGLAVLSYSLTHLYRVVAVALQIVDVPNDRSAHKVVTPTGAGVVFVSLYCLGMVLAAYTGALQFGEMTFFQALVPGVLISVLGLIDDYRALPWLVRGALHLAAAVCGVWLVGFPELVIGSLSIDFGLVGLLLGVLSLAWMTNLYNFMDGIDGIAAGEALFVVIGVTAIGVIAGEQKPSVTVLLLASVMLGFLIINWPKARVFMGDVGSGFLGFLMGLFVLAEVLVPVWCWLILLGWFVTDACLTILMRLARGERIYEAHALHAYQHLNRFVGTGYTLFIIGALNIFWLLPMAVLAYEYPEFAAGLLLLAYIPLLIFQSYCGAGQLLPRAIGAKD